MADAPDTVVPSGKERVECLSPVFCFPLCSRCWRGTRANEPYDRRTWGGQTEFAVLILCPGDQNPSPGGPSVPSLEAAEPSSLRQVLIDETGYKARNLQELSPMMLAHVRVEPRLLA